MPLSRQLISKLLPPLALTLLVLATYWPVLNSEFVNYDDDVYVTANARVQNGLTWSNVKWAFTTTEAEFWHPLTWLSHMGVIEFFGKKPIGHHLINLVLHVANALFVFFIFQRLTGFPWRSFVIAALFGLHPLHVESVAWIAERKDVLSAFFGLASLYCYIRFAQSKTSESPKQAFPHRKVRYYALTLLFFTLGLMSKSMLVTLPFVFLLLDYWPLQRLQPNGPDKLENCNARFWMLIREKIWFFLLAFVAGAAAYWIQASRGNLGKLEQYPVSLRLANALVSYWAYLRKTFWPADLAVFYPYPHGSPMLKIAAAAVVLAAITVLAIRMIRRQPYVAVGWFWFAGMLFPVIGLAQVGHHSMADRYTYLPLIGLFLVFVWLVADLTARASNSTIQRFNYLTHLTSFLSILTIAACVLTTRAQLQSWQNSESLSRYALAVTKDNYVAYNNLGNVFLQRGDLNKATAHYTTALQIKTNFAAAHSNLGLLLVQQGRTEEATAHFLAALRSEPRNATAHYFLGGIFERSGRTAEAITHYQEALRLRPDFAETWNDLGTLVASENQWKEAAQYFHQAVHFMPEYAEAHNNLGSAEMNIGNLAQAASEFTIALRLKPEYPDAQCNLAKALYYQRQHAAAVPHFLAALRANPDRLEALDLLARVRATSSDPSLRDGSEAIRLASRAAELTQNRDPRVLDTLAAAYAEAGQFYQAAATINQAISAAKTSGPTDLATSLRPHLDLYRAGKPLRE